MVDNGVGPGARRTREKRRGTVLASRNRARLNHLYGERHAFETGPVKTGGFAVRLSLPLRRSSISEPRLEEQEEAVS